MENKPPIDKEKIKKLIEEVFSKPIETERKLTMYAFDPSILIQLNQMMKEEAERYINNNKAPIQEKK